MIPRTTMMMVTLLMLMCGGVDGWSQDTWVKTFGGTESERGYVVKTTMNEGVLITGATNSNNGDFQGMNKGNGDIFVIKLDSNGEMTWKRTFGGREYDSPSSITTTSDDGVLISGSTESRDGDFQGMNKGEGDIFVIKLDKDGNVRWKKMFGGSNDDYARSIITHSDGTVLITGEFNSNNGDFQGMNKGGGDIFIIKLDSNGNVLWQKTYGGSGDDGGESLITDSDGELLIAGSTNSNDGYFNGMSKGNRDIFVIKLDNDGETVWKKTFGGREYEYPTSITITSNDGVLISGDTYSNDGEFRALHKGAVDIFVIKLDKDGEIQWKNTFGGRSYDYARSMTTRSDNNIILTGWTNSNDGDFRGIARRSTIVENDCMGDIFIMILDKDGRVVRRRTIGGKFTDEGYSITTTTDGETLITGATESNDDDFRDMNRGRFDIFVMKLDRNGNLKPSGKKKSKKK